MDLVAGYCSARGVVSVLISMGVRSRGQQHPQVRGRCSHSLDQLVVPGCNTASVGVRASVLLPVTFLEGRYQRVHRVNEFRRDTVQLVIFVQRVPLSARVR